MAPQEAKTGSKLLADKLRELRGPLSQPEAAIRSGVSPKTWQNIENQMVDHPWPSTLRKIADAFGVDADELWALQDARPLVERFSDEELDRLAARLAPLLALHLRRLDQ